MRITVKLLNAVENSLESMVYYIWQSFSVLVIKYKKNN